MLASQLNLTKVIDHMSFISVCKNIIQQNNKRKWEDPEPPIRVANTKSGKATFRCFEVDIVDGDGNVVASILTTKDGKPILNCGAKVAITTIYPVRIRNETINSR